MQDFENGFPQQHPIRSRRVLLTLRFAIGFPQVAKDASHLGQVVMPCSGRVLFDRKGSAFHFPRR